MLPAQHRLTRSQDFGFVVRRGRRAGRRTLVVHAAGAPGGAERSASVPSSDVRVGFVVSRAVGGSVVRNRVERRLRAAVAPLVPALPAGTHLVVRALPPAADADFRTLDVDLTSALRRIGLMSS